MSAKGSRSNDQTKKAIVSGSKEEMIACNGKFHELIIKKQEEGTVS
ncbi:hypothetical protein ACFOU2_20250 [Bacillus songklensis]|uniref:Uncharacterized protein n=1 Tax=Bacillus songklensis TaxID=1069116 RepID=A0ABV8B5Y7_9BACI